MIKLKFESAGHPDYSRILGAEMDKEYTVLGFIGEILKMYPKDYGSINIDDEIFLEYKDGVLDWSFINLRLSGLVVEKVEGMSSYYNTDYKLVSKKDADKQEKKIGLGKDCRIDFDSVENDNASQNGWCATQKEMDEIYLRREVSVNDLFDKKYKFVHDLEFAIEQFEKETGVSIKFVKYDWDRRLVDIGLDI